MQNEMEMESELAQLRKVAHELVSHLDAGQETPVHYLPQTVAEQWSATSISLNDLSTNTTKVVSENAVQVHEQIVLAEACLRSPNTVDLQADVKEPAIKLQEWTVANILPPRVFAEKSLFDPDPTDAVSQHEIARWRSMLTVGLRLLSHLHERVPSLREHPTLDLVTCLASFTNERDPWTTPEAHKYAQALLQELMQPRKNDASSKQTQDLLAALLEKRVKPLFAKTKNPVITQQGRKATHPLPAPMDLSEMELEAKPWKFRAAYIITVFGWIVGQLNLSGLEHNWPMIIPPLLATVDDEATDNKIKGCELLMKFLRLTPSSLLERTGLGEVFYDALMPCLSYLPSLTPEEEALRLLTAVYPTLMTLVQTRFPTDNSRPKMRALDSILRTGILKGYALAGEYVKIGELLVYRMADVVDAMGINSVKHLKELVPLIVGILSAPFSTSYPPLLRAAAHALNVIILNDWPRISSYRGDVLRGAAICWLSIHEERILSLPLQDVARDLQITVRLLKVAMSTANVDVAKEFAMLTNSNVKLEDLLQN